MPISISIQYLMERLVKMPIQRVIKYDDTIATANVGLGVKKEGKLVIAGTQEHVYIPHLGGKQNTLKYISKTKI